MSERLLRAKLRKIDGACAGTCVVIAAAGYLLGIRPAVQQRMTLSEARTALVDQERRAAEAENEVYKLKGRLADLQNRLSTMDVRLDTADRINTRFERITKLADQNGLALNQMAPGMTASGDRFVTVPIRMSGTGTFGGCVAFLGTLVKDYRDLGVSGFHLAAMQQPGRTDATFAFDLTWYAAPAASAGVSDSK